MTSVQRAHHDPELQRQIGSLEGRGHGADSVLHAFWLSMADTRNGKQSFVATFDVTAEEFYADFERYRTTLDPVS